MYPTKRELLKFAMGSEDKMKTILIPLLKINKNREHT